MPVDESALDEALEEFQTRYHPATRRSLSETALDLDDGEEDEDEDRARTRAARTRSEPTACSPRGAEAPDFTLPDQNGEPFSLKDPAASWVVLYFYPRADTPGCTTQACGVRDHSADYDDGRRPRRSASPPTRSTRSPSSTTSTTSASRCSPTPTTPSPRPTATWVEKSMYGNKYMGVQRATFLIDPDGKVARVFPKVQPKKHDDLVLDALAELSA